MIGYPSVTSKFWGKNNCDQRIYTTLKTTSDMHGHMKLLYSFFLFEKVLEDNCEMNPNSGDMWQRWNGGEQWNQQGWCKCLTDC